MNTRQFLLAAAAASLIGTAAHAQSALVEIDDDVQVAPFNATVDQVDDWDVFSMAGVEIGEVEEVVGTDANTPTALVVDFEGNEGYADREVVIPLDQFSLDNNRLSLRADPTAVGQMQTWDD